MTTRISILHFFLGGGHNPGRLLRVCITCYHKLKMFVIIQHILIMLLLRRYDVVKQETVLVYR